MKVRIFKNGDKVKVLIPSYPDALEKDTKRFYSGIEYFDCDSLSIPARKDINGECLRCHWKFDGVGKKVYVEKTFECEHDKLKSIQDKINNSDKQIALDGLLELERFKLNKKV